MMTMECVFDCFNKFMVTICLGSFGNGFGNIDFVATIAHNVKLNIFLYH